MEMYLQEHRSYQHSDRRNHKTGFIKERCVVILENLGFIESDKSSSSLKNAYLNIYTVFSMTFKDIHGPTKVSFGF